MQLSETFLAGVLVRSPGELLIFIANKIIYRIEVSKNKQVGFEKRFIGAA